MDKNLFLMYMYNYQYVPALIWKLLIPVGKNRDMLLETSMKMTRPDPYSRLKQKYLGIDTTLQCVYSGAENKFVLIKSEGIVACCLAPLGSIEWAEAF